MRVAVIDRERVGVDTPRGHTTVRRVRPYRARVVVGPETFRARLRRLRNEHGLSQRGLAAASGVSKGVIFEAERGGWELSAHSLSLLARALDVSMHALYLGEGAAS